MRRAWPWWRSACGRWPEAGLTTESVSGGVHAVDDELHGERRHDDAKQARQHDIAGNAKEPGDALRHHEDHDTKFTDEERRGNPLDAHTVHVMRSVEQSKQINDVHTPAIIISASGMATGGRVLHHLAKRLPDPRNCVLLAGFQAQGTRGRALEDGAKYLTIHGAVVPVRAEVTNLHQFSAHAGRGELLRWLGGLPSPPKRVYIVHGEPEASAALQSAIGSQFGWNTTLPEYLQSFDLTPQED